MSDSPSFDFAPQAKKLLDAINGKPTRVRPNTPKGVTTKKRAPKTRSPKLHDPEQAIARHRKKYGKIIGSYWMMARERILVRDSYRCSTCKVKDPLLLDIHHIVPSSQGGSDSPDNLITLCANCHRLADAGKYTRDYLSVLVPRDEVRDATDAEAIAMMFDDLSRGRM